LRNSRPNCMRIITLFSWRQFSLISSSHRIGETMRSFVIELRIWQKKRNYPYWLIMLRNSIHLDLNYIRLMINNYLEIWPLILFLLYSWQDSLALKWKRENKRVQSSISLLTIASITYKIHPSTPQPRVIRMYFHKSWVMRTKISMY